MRSKKRILNIKCFLILLLSSGILLSTSCQKKWKKPTTASFNFQLSSSSGSLTNFTSAYLNLNKISFNGVRSQGVQQISLDQQPGNMQVNYSQKASSTGIKFDIPQGTYSRISIDMVTSLDQKGNSLQVDGTYVDSLNKTFAVRFTFAASSVTSMLAVNSSGNNTVILVEGTPATATIVMNPTYWFSPISRKMMDSAEHEMINNVATIEISKDENESLYNLVVSRIKDGNSVIFN